MDLGVLVLVILFTFFDTTSAHVDFRDTELQIITMSGAYADPITMSPTGFNARISGKGGHASIYHDFKAKLCDVRPLRRPLRYPKV